jgi:hypothetical protein
MSAEGVLTALRRDAPYLFCDARGVRLCVVLDCRLQTEYSGSEASRTAKSVHKGSPWHKLKGL